ncbi:M48 family metalloprotease [Comamonas humi]
MHAQSHLPAMGEGAEMTTSDERRLGNRIMQQIYRDPDYIDDPILYEYVNGIWQHLVAAAKQRGNLGEEQAERFAWQVLLIRDPTVNAFALPGGFMGVQTGLIGVVGSRDELASVLAHEISHITQRHIARMMAQEKRMTPVMIGSMILGALAASKNPAAAQALAIGGTAAVVQTQLNFSRDMEREADRTGFGLMQPGGFAQGGFVTMFEKLEQASRINDNGSWPYLRSHPLTTQRIADMQSRLPAGARSSMAGQDSGLVAQMMGARARVLSRPGPGALRQWAEQPANSTFARKAPPQQAADLYAAALACSQLGQHAQAQTLWEQLLQLVQTHGQGEALRQARLLQADLALAARQPAQALQALEPMLQAGNGAAPAAAGAQVTAVENAMTGTVSSAVISRGADQSLSIADADPRAPVAAAPAMAGDSGQRRTDGLLATQALVRLGASGAAQHEALIKTLTGGLQTITATQPRDAPAWQALSALWQLQGQPLRAVRADAEARAAQYDYAAAVDRLKAGQDLARKGGPGADYFEASIIDTRLREMQSLAKEQAADK